LIDKISKTWETLVYKINQHPEKYSSEKSMVFNFAWDISLSVNNNINVDFEKTLFDKEFSDGSFLDLYIEYESASGLEKFGFEFKFPKKSSTGNSNQTQTRIKMINDIKRLTYLVNEDKIDYGIFLMATDEAPYTYLGDKKNASAFKTYQDVEYSKGSILPIDNNLSKENVILCNKIEFKWKGLTDIKKIDQTIAWLNPIVLSNRKF